MRCPRRRVASPRAARRTGPGPAVLWRGQAGMMLLEVLLVMALMVFIAGSMSALVGAAVRSKLIVSARSADTQTARQALEWMSERLRNAGLNVRPGHASQAGYPPRCRDRVVAQDPALRPTATSVYVSGEILNTNHIAGDEIDTLGFYLDASNGVIMEFRQRCPDGSPATSPLTNPRVRVTGLAFRYFRASGIEVTDLTTVAEIRRIQMIRIAMTVEAADGTSGVQVQTFARDVMLRNPEPYANDWMNRSEVMR